MGAKQKILVIDDDRDIRYLLSRYLKKNEFEVVEAESGNQALAEVVNSRPDLILCDFVLHGVEGLALLKELHERHGSIPVIIVTGYEDLTIAAEVRKLGAIAYVVKPIILQNILVTIRKALAGAPNHSLNMPANTNEEK